MEFIRNFVISSKEEVDDVVGDYIEARKETLVGEEGFIYFDYCRELAADDRGEVPKPMRDNKRWRREYKYESRLTMNRPLVGLWGARLPKE